jgi:hypothetical protein
MAVWKVLLIGLFGCACLALATATFVVPFNYTGGMRLLWLGVLVAATAFTGGLFALFLRHASAGMLVKSRSSQH